MELWFVKSLAARKLIRLSNYRDMSELPAVSSPELSALQLGENETIIGVYENTPGYLDDSIVVTDIGLHVRQGSVWLTIPYTAMQEVDGPATKAEISGLTVTLSNGTQEFIPVRGAQEQFRDAFPVLRFLLSVHRKLSQERSASST